MRFAIGGFAHETNTFGTILVTEAFLEKRKRRGERIITASRGVHSNLGGMIDECEARGIELVPTLLSGLSPSGPTEQAAFEAFLEELVDRLWNAHQEKPLDGILLNLHGAGVAFGYHDLEGTLLKAVRDRFGREMPIGIELDLHGNITPEIIDLCDVAVGFKCYPHVDGYECARHMVSLLCDRIASGTPIGKSLIKLPWHLAPAFGVTLSGPAHDIQQLIYKMVEEEEELLDATFFHGFPYADIPFSGVGIVTMAKTQESADRYAHTIAEYAWSRRKDFIIPTHSAEEAMDLAEQAEAPVVVNESSDNPGGGAPGDGTHLLREMLKRDLPGTVYGHIYDPEVTKQAVAAGVGATIDCLLGAKSDYIHGTPVELKGAYVKTISDGRYIKKNPMGAGAMQNMGPTVLLQVGNVGIIVSGNRSQNLDDGPFRIVGVDYRDMRILALKSSQHFKGWWVGRAKTIIACDSPGIHGANLNDFEYKYLNKDYFPFKDAAWN